MDIKAGEHELNNLSKINIVLGKNGCGKSTLLKTVERVISGNKGAWAVTRYITPERGGSLIYEAGVEQQVNRNINYLSETRRANQNTQFKEQSFVQFRKLENIVLKEIEKNHERRADFEYTFEKYIEKINALLDNICLKRDETAFKIFLRNPEQEIQPKDISSGESELISLAIESLIFAKQSSNQSPSVLFLDEPDVHLHPDLQARLVQFLKNIVKEGNVTIIIASHSTALLGELNDYSDASIAFMGMGEKIITFEKISGVYKKILPVFGAHPLSDIFNQAPPLLVEGEDDERIWQQAVRTSVGAIRLYPVSTDSVQNLSSFEDEAVKILKCVYDTPKGYSFRDRDDKPYDIDDKPPIIRARLSCKNAENLILTNEVLGYLGVTWDVTKTKIDAWVNNDANISHPHFQMLKSFVEKGYDRTSFDIKDLRQLIVGGIIGSAKPWEVCVGKVIGQIPTQNIPKNYPENSIYDFLGEKIIKIIIQSPQTARGDKP